MTGVRQWSLIAIALIPAAAVLRTTPIAAQGPAVAATESASRNNTLRRTSWGDPDLQGIWTNIADINVPFQRPKEFAGTPHLTREQTAERTRLALERYDRDAEGRPFLAGGPA